MATRRRSSRAPLQQISLRRPSQRALITAAATLIVAAASLVDHQCVHRTTKTTPDPVAIDKQAGTVTHVVDGDTIDVVVKQGEPAVRVRLLGIDAPEVEGPSKQLGLAASQYAKARCEGQQVTLRLDELQREHDKYGRMLAYVYLPNSELLNASLVRDGMAFSHRKLRCDLSAQLDAAENEARGAKRGLWKTVTPEQMPQWRRDWMSEHGLK